MDYNTIEKFYLSGAKAFNIAIDNAAAVDVSSSYPDVNRGAVIRIPVTAHGFLVSPDFEKGLINSILIRGSVNYNGMHAIKAVAANTIDILVKTKFVAETFSGSETINAGFEVDEDCDFLGYRVHAATALADENLVTTIDNHQGSAWDTVLDTQSMSALTDYVKMFNPPEPLSDGDMVFVTHANTGTDTWGIEFLIGKRN